MVTKTFVIPKKSLTSLSVQLMCIFMPFTFFPNATASYEPFAVEHKVFEIVIPSFNNAVVAEKNLASVCFQNYPRNKYHITYINDASTDKTGEIVAQFIARNKLEKHVKLINNKTRKGQLENRYRTFHSLPNDTIIAECDGDDFYADDNVLSELNKFYQNSDIWMLYTIRFKTFPGNRIVNVKPFTQDEIAHHSFRNVLKRPTSQLRSYYAGLFKQIKLKDLLYEGKFYPVLTDPAYMIPMLEMAGHRYKSVQKILYLWNTSNPMSVANIWDRNFRRKICDYLSVQKPYPLIEDFEQIISKNEYIPPEVIICSSSEALAGKMLSNVNAKFSGYDRCTVFLELAGKQQAEYHTNLGPSIDVVCSCYDPEVVSFRNLLVERLRKIRSRYVALFLDGNINIDRPIDLKKCVNVLDGCFAKIFYAAPLLCQELPCVQIKERLWASQFKYRGMLLENGMFPDAMIYSRKFLLHQLDNINFNTAKELSRRLAMCPFPPNEVGIFYR
jgi:glycosyltransferase involved in cell wall biosynthesis